jgi:hypothetical protein
MDLKPQNFFIGVVDFFSVWLPGAIFTWFLKIIYYDPVLNLQLPCKVPANEVAEAVFFLVVSYIIGNILFGFSSLLDTWYDKKLRKIFRPKDKEHLELEVKTAAAIKNTFINTDQWLARLNKSGELTNEQLKHLYSKKYRHIFNTYKWSQHYLLFNHPEALADVKRTEADSKFFRSLVLTFFIMSILLFINFHPLTGIAFFLVSLVSLYLFSTYRYKATIRAYELVITHYYLKPGTDTGLAAETISTSVLKSGLQDDFVSKYGKRISFLTAGFQNTPQQVTIRTGEWDKAVFAAENNESWYCMDGKGMLIIKSDQGETQHFLASNAIIPLAKGISFSLKNLQDQPLELLVITN